MEVSKKYVVYEFNKIMGTNQLSLEEVKFKGFTMNWFDSEDQAIQALVEDKKLYQDYVILCQVRIHPEN
jgi:hypothetical protein